MEKFNNKLKKRIELDRENFKQSFSDIASVVSDLKNRNNLTNSHKNDLSGAISKIFSHYKIKFCPNNKSFESINEELEYYLTNSGVMKRSIILKNKWWKDATGAILGKTKNGQFVALIPNKFSGYSFFDYEKHRKVKINSKNSQNLETNAVCFYKPFPLAKLNTMNLSKFVVSMVSSIDLIFVIVISIIMQCIGLINPYVNNILIKKVIPTGNTDLIIPFASLLLGMVFSTKLISITGSLISTKISAKISLGIESACMGRVLLLPASFFKKYSSGELSVRVSGIQRICEILSNIIFSNILPSLCSFVYVFSMRKYAKILVIPGLIFILVQLIFTIVATMSILKFSRQSTLISTKLKGLVVSLFSGIQKIKLSGAERRAFIKWEKLYKTKAELSFNPPLFIKIIPIFSSIISMLGTLTIFFIAGKNHISQANYYPFNVAFSSLSGVIMSLSNLSSSIAEIKSLSELAKPIMDEIPELNENKKNITHLNGEIEFKNVSFRYNENTELILDNFNLKILPGQYIAVTGKTGCGKSTLVRLLLGFEKPQSGSIFYDGINIENIDLRFLRQKIGVVMQNGKLFHEDIFTNITISAPWLNMQDAWEAAKLACVDKDIREMPMGMKTLLTEDNTSISGGQKQRIMIARAVVSKPNILIFDEATSSLDNITQQKISNSLDNLKNTRITIAHRLSTIKNCDRILFLENGKITEDGTYRDLINKKGSFFEFVKRQQIKENL